MRYDCLCCKITNRTRDKINKLTAKDPTVGYRLAWHTIHGTYGQPHVIAICCKQRLKFRDVKPVYVNVVQVSQWWSTCNL